MPKTPHPNVAQEAQASNDIPLMSTFPVSKIYQCQFCLKFFLREWERRKHNDLEYRDYALAHITMDEVGEASDEAGGARDVMGEASGEAQMEMDEVGEASGEAGGARDVVVVIAILKEAITFQIAEFVMNVLTHTSSQREMYGCA
jgi:hypothetical protein